MTQNLSAEQIADREDRTTSLGLLRYAEEYRRGADIVKQADDESVVPYMLVTHSLELSLKAFLRSRGATLDDLQCLGHNLRRLHRAAMRKRLDRLWPEAASLRPTLRVLDSANRGQGLRYIINGATQRPAWFVVNAFAHGLIQALTEHCLRDRFNGKAGAAEVRRNRGSRIFAPPVPRPSRRGAAVN